MALYDNLDTRKIERIEQQIVEAGDAVLDLTVQIKQYLQTHTAFQRHWNNDEYHAPALRDSIGTLRVNAKCMMRYLENLLDATATDYTYTS